MMGQMRDVVWDRDAKSLARLCEPARTPLAISPKIPYSSLLSIKT